MSDNINFNEQTGKYAYYGVKDPAWHLKGHTSGVYENSGEVLVKSQLDFTVAMNNNRHLFPSGKEVVSSTSFFTYRTDSEKVLGSHVSKDYTIVQNIDAFAFMDSIVGASNIRYETAGALGNGEIVFITAKLPKHIQVLGQDTIEQYIFVTTRHDGKGSIIGGLTPVRIVCNNTLNAALKGCQTQIRIRHTENAHAKLKQAQELLQVVDKASPILEQAFNHLAKVRISDLDLRKLMITALAPKKEVLQYIKAGNWEPVSSQFQSTIEQVASYAFTSGTQQLESTKGTLFGAYNAITGFFQNRYEFKNEQVKMKNIIYGGNAQRIVQKTLDLCFEYEKYGESVLLN